MPLNKVDQAKIKRIENDLNEIAEPIQPKKSAIMKALGSIPIFANLFRSVDISLTSTSQIAIGIKQTAEVAQKAATGLQYIAIAIAAVELFALPAYLIGSWQLGQKPEFKLSKAAKLAFLTLTLTLLVAIVVFPAAAPIIGTVVAGLALATSVASFGKYFYEKYKLKQALKKDEGRRANEEESLADLRATAEGYLDAIKKETFDLHSAQTKTEYNEFIAKYEEVRTFIQDYDEKKATLKLMNKKAALDKAIGIGLAGAIFTGVVVAVFLPYVGLAIGAVTGLVGASYVAGRIGMALFGSRSKKESNVVAPKAQNGVDNKPDVAPNLVDQNSDVVIYQKLAEKNKDKPNNWVIMEIDLDEEEDMDLGPEEELGVKNEAIATTYENYMEEDFKTSYKDYENEDESDGEGEGEKPPVCGSH